MLSHRGFAAIVAIVTMITVSVGCGNGNGYSKSQDVGSNQTTSPTPAITTASPNSAAAGGAAFTLTINGTNFVAASVVNFGGVPQATTFVSATQLTAAIPAAAIATSAGSVFAVTVTNPAPGGGTSNAVAFTITSPNPVPTITSISPSCSPQGEQSLDGSGSDQLLINGGNFLANSVVRWNGNDRPTTFHSSSQLTAQISANDISVAGATGITVFNPAPGGGSSNVSTFTISTSGVGPQSIAVDPTGKFAYVADEGCGNPPIAQVSMYTINSNTGALAPIGIPVVSNDEGGRALTVNPSGKFVYLLNWGEGDTAGSISTYAINASTGALTSTPTIYGLCPGLCAPSSVAVDPSGKFAYVANEGGFTPTSVSMYTIDATTGALTSTGTIASGGRAQSVAVDPSGRFAYVANFDSNNISIYTINSTTGTLIAAGTVPTGSSPSGVTVDPSGSFAYSTNSGSDDISIYTINSTTGILTGAGTVPGGSSPSRIAIDPSGSFAYVTNLGSNNVSMYTIDSTTGLLTATGTIPAGLSPSSITIHPSGKFVYVTNHGSNDISVYGIDGGTGLLTLLSTTGT